jgi:hypothetical protein
MSPADRDPAMERAKATRLRKRVLFMFLSMEQPSLFPDTRHDATDAEVVSALRVAIARGGRLPRFAELYLASISAEYLVDALRSAGLDFVRRDPRSNETLP